MPLRTHRLGGRIPGICLPVPPGGYTPLGICPYTPPRVHHRPTEPAHGYPHTAGRTGNAALTRAVVELTVRHESLTVTPPVSLLDMHHPFHWLARKRAGQGLLPWVMRVRGTVAQTARLIFRHPFHCWMMCSPSVPAPTIGLLPWVGAVLNIPVPG